MHSDLLIQKMDPKPKDVTTEEPTSSSCHSLKRKLSENSENRSSACCASVKLLKESSCSDRTSTALVPDCTSEWTEDTLNKLQISSNTGNLLSANEIIEEHFLKSLDPFTFNTHGSKVKSASSEPLMAMVNKCIEILDIDSSPLKSLDVDDVIEVNSSLAYSLTFWNPDADRHIDEPENQRLHRRIKSWMPEAGKVEADSDTYIYLKWFLQKFYVHGHAFTQQLLNMCVRKGNELLKDDMFENLFQEFAGMFGLMFLTRSQQSGSTFTIGDKEVTSKPDIIFPYFMESDEVSMKVLAVCEVECDFEEKDLGLPKKCMLQKNMDIGSRRRKRHLDEKLLGQHGGELLVHLPQTENCSLLGIIVQRTNVTFSHITCYEDQLDKLQSGQLPGKFEINYSRPYNFLRAKDRKILIKAFLTLSAVQLTPYM